MDYMLSRYACYLIVQNFLFSTFRRTVKGGGDNRFAIFWLSTTFENFGHSCNNLNKQKTALAGGGTEPVKGFGAFGPKGPGIAGALWCFEKREREDSKICLASSS